MNWLESLIYGFISGLSEFLPISSRAHQNLMLVLFGESGHDPIRDMLVHIAILFSIYSGCRALLEQIRRETRSRLHSRSPRSRSIRLFDVRLVKHATIPMLAGILILSYATGSHLNLMWTSLFLLLNGIVLFIPERMIRTNRDARTMSGFDSALIGISSALCALPGFSRVGCGTSVAIARGAEPKKAFDWAILLSIPAVILFIAIDFFAIFSFGGLHLFWSNFFGYLLSAVGAYIGGYLAIFLMKFLSERSGFFDFSYYCWGAALISFILYLIVV